MNGDATSKPKLVCGTVVVGVGLPNPYYKCKLIFGIYYKTTGGCPVLSIDQNNLTEILTVL